VGREVADGSGLLRPRTADDTRTATTNGHWTRTTYDTNPFDATFSQNIAGRLAAVQNGATTNGDTFIEMYSYAQPGKLTKKRLRLSRSVQSHTITGDLDAQYSYDNEGKMTSVTYPQSSYIDPNTLQVLQSPVTTYTYAFDTMGRPTSMTGPGADNWGNPTTVNIVNNVQYGPASELLQMSYFGATETRQYNTRLQMTHLTVPGQLNISYNFATQNNGQIASQTDNLSGEQITYQYDALKRLYSATASAWTQTFTYDGFGNLTDKIGTGTAPTNHSPVNAATNQLTGYSYDPNGNLITTGFGWDPENRMSYALAGNTQYAYDSKNKRVWVGNFTCVGQSCDPNYNTGWQLSSETIFFYGVDGRRLASYTPQVQYSYGTPQSIYYLLGEERVFFGTKYIGIANTTLMSGGTAVGRDRLESAGKYFPYGEERNSPQWPNDTLKFASYTRDSATGLDYADQRYYAGGSGRFLSPDPYTASGGPAEPGSWNRYAYVGGDPANYYDPQGLFIGGPPRYDPGQPPTEDFGSVFCAVFPDVCEADNDRIGNPDVGGPPEPGCSIELWQRGAGFSGNPGGHTYLLIDDPTDGQLMVEAGPDHDPGPNQGTLRGFENPPGDGLGKGTGHASDPGKPNNHEIGTPYTGADACSDINEILSAVTNYNSGTRVPYFLLGTYNSNGFTFTLLSDVGLSGFFGSLPKRPNPFHPKRRFFPGWGEIVPGLVPSP
jgi:RHS repeat-associated protein